MYIYVFLSLRLAIWRNTNVNITHNNYYNDNNNGTNFVIYKSNITATTLCCIYHT